VAKSTGIAGEDAAPHAQNGSELKASGIAKKIPLLWVELPLRK